MAWTTPRDWVTAEIVTESMMDVHVRDNLTYLKDIQDGVQSQDFTWQKSSTDAVGKLITARKSRGSIGSPTAVSANDIAFDLIGQGYNAAAYRGLGTIRSFTWAVGATFLEGAMDFSVNRSSDGTLVRHMRMVGGQVAFPDGAVGASAICFDADADNGLYRIGADNWALAVGGSKGLELLKSGGSVQVLLPNTALNGAVAWFGDTDTGFHWEVANEMRFDAGGAPSGTAFQTGAQNYFGPVSRFASGGTSAAATVTTLVNKLPIYNLGGTLLGYIPIYQNFT